MKNITLFTLITLALFYSCKKSNITNPSSDNSSLDKVSLIGKWYYISDTVRHSTNNGPLTILVTNNNYKNGEYWQFNADGTGSNFYNSATNIYSYTTSHDSITVTFPASTVNNTIVPLHSEVLTIKSISATKLSLLAHEVQINSINNNRTDIYDNAFFTR